MTIAAGDTVELTAKKKSGHGQNILRLFGESMDVNQVRDHVIFSTQPGPWLLVTSDVGSGHCRWINVDNDRLFTVTKAETDQ